MDGPNNQSQSTAGVGFPQNDPSNSAFPVSNAQPVSNSFPGDMPSADAPIPQNNSSTLVPPSNDSGGTGGGKTSFGKSNRKVLATILGLVLLIAGVGTGVYLVGQQQNVSTRAYNCSKYVFEVKQDGEVTIRNGTVRVQPYQRASIYIDGKKVDALAVPKIDPGATLSLGKVAVPSSGVFKWRVEGSFECKTMGEYTANTGSSAPQCSEVATYNTEWVSISSSDLTKLKPGDKVRFAVTASADSGTFEAAKFTINSVEQPETRDHRVQTNGTQSSTEFYMDYTIPSSVNKFDVSAKVKHSSAGWF